MSWVWLNQSEPSTTLNAEWRFELQGQLREDILVREEGEGGDPENPNDDIVTVPLSNARIGFKFIFRPTPTVSNPEPTPIEWGWLGVYNGDASGSSSPLQADYFEEIYHGSFEPLTVGLLGYWQPGSGYYGNFVWNIGFKRSPQNPVYEAEYGDPFYFWGAWSCYTGFPPFGYPPSIPVYIFDYPGVMEVYVWDDGSLLSSVWGTAYAIEAAPEGFWTLFDKTYEEIAP